MLLTTSRRPGHRTRILCRELSWVIPNSRYIPRGTKTIEELNQVALASGHDRIALVSSGAGGPMKLRFLEAGQDWRWLNPVVKLGAVKLQREVGPSYGLKDLKVYGQGHEAYKFAITLGKLLGSEISQTPPSSGGVALITAEDGITLQFLVKDNSEAIGPILRVVGLGRVSEERAGENGKV